ncbi:Protein SYS1 [Cyberlindnera fabianii]|nr:Protein SYS1 [Cyberlindnera fabianii]
MNTVRNFAAGFTRLPHYTEFAFKTADQLAPATILKQIVMLQCFYYATAIIACYLVAWLQGFVWEWAWVFSWEPVTLENSVGFALITMWLCDAFVCVLFMTIIVGRSKLAWDFALTIHAVNLLVVWAYSGKFPNTLIWWAVQGASSLILVSLGTYTSRWRELRDTFFEGLADAEMGQARGPGEVIEMTDHTDQTAPTRNSTN